MVYGNNFTIVPLIFIHFYYAFKIGRLVCVLHSIDCWPVWTFCFDDYFQFHSRDDDDSNTHQSHNYNAVKCSSASVMNSKRKVEKREQEIGVDSFIS